MSDTTPDLAGLQERLRDLPEAMKSVIREGVGPAPRRWVLAVFTQSHTPRGYIPSVVYEDESGHYPMIGSGEHAQPWYFGHDLAVAQRLCDEANEARGISPDEARSIVDSSIMLSIRESSAKEETDRRLRELGLR